MTRKTNARGKLTTAIKPIVEVMPSLATDQKSAAISEIHRSHRLHAIGVTEWSCFCFNTGLSELIRSSNAAA